MNINNIKPVSATSEVASVESMPPQVKADAAKMNKVQEMESSSKTKDKKGAFSNKETQEMVEVLNEFMDDLQTNLGFSIREDLNHQVVVEIKDRKTDELIKQIPTEEMLMIKEKMEELTGLIFDQSI